MFTAIVTCGCSLLAPSDVELVGGQADASAGWDARGAGATGGSGASAGAGASAESGASGESGATRDAERDTNAETSSLECDSGCSAAELCLADGSVTECVAPAAALHGQRWDLRCGTPYGSNSCRLYPPGTTTCPQAGFYPVNKTVRFGGRPGALYDLRLRFRGVVEPKTYTGGTPGGDNFHIGGMPSRTNYNVYSFSVSAPTPAVTYYLNSEPVRGEGEYVFKIDYQKTITIAGGATIILSAYTLECGLLRNCADLTAQTCTPLVVAGLTPAPNTNGHFIQVDVVSVTERP